MKKDDNTFSCLVAVCAFVIAGFIGVLIFGGGSDNGTQSSPDPQVVLQVKKNQVDNTNGMTDNEFWSGVGAAALYLLL